MPPTTLGVGTRGDALLSLSLPNAPRFAAFTAAAAALLEITFTLSLSLLPHMRTRPRSNGIFNVKLLRSVIISNRCVLFKWKKLSPCRNHQAHRNHAVTLSLVKHWIRCSEFSFDSWFLSFFSVFRSTLSGCFSQLAGISTILFLECYSVAYQHFSVL